MLGTVSYIDKKSGLFIIRDMEGEFTLALVMEKYDISLGTVLSGEIRKLCCSTLKNEITEELFPVLILESRCPEKEILLNLKRAKRITHL